MTIKGPAIFLAQFAGDDPPFDTLDNITKWASDLGYTGVQLPSWDGRMIDLKKALQHKLKEQDNLEYTTEQIIVSNGAKQCLSVACQALFDKGDKVLVFTPYWVSFPEFVKIAGATPVFVNTVSDKQYCLLYTSPSQRDVE